MPSSWGSLAWRTRGARALARTAIPKALSRRQATRRDVPRTASARAAG
jgi:hypothetical protein